MIKWINKKRNKKGFTLVELVVVIAILGILAALAVPKLIGTRDTAKIKADEATLKTIQSAWNIYLAEGDTAKGWPEDYLEGKTDDKLGKTSITIDGSTYTYSDGNWSK